MLDADISHTARYGLNHSVRCGTAGQCYVWYTSHSVRCGINHTALGVVYITQC